MPTKVKGMDPRCLLPEPSPNEAERPALRRSTAKKMPNTGAVRASGGAAGEPMLWLRDVERGFVGPRRQSIPVLRIAELRVERGAGLLVLGPNGTGKTTLLHLLAGLLRADRGAVVVAGCDLGKLSESARDRWRARSVGYLLQGSALLDGLTAEENVMVALLLAGASARKQKRRAAELLDRFDVGHRARHRPAEMSGGERQRVALARALANDPPIVLVDEPTASLDRSGASKIVECLTELGREQRTVVVATHHPELFDASYGRFELGRSAVASEAGSAP